MKEPTSESREAPRMRTLKRANITFNGRQSVITCTIRNLSRKGALLELPSIIGTPREFELSIDGTYRSVRVIWRSKTQLGVAWIDLRDQQKALGSPPDRMRPRSPFERASPFPSSAV
jgi:hypothetical protein